MESPSRPGTQTVTTAARIIPKNFDPIWETGHAYTWAIPSLSKQYANRTHLYRSGHGSTGPIRAPIRGSLTLYPAKVKDSRKLLLLFNGLYRHAWGRPRPRPARWTDAGSGSARRHGGGQPASRSAPSRREASRANSSPRNRATSPMPDLFARASASAL